MGPLSTANPLIGMLQRPLIHVAVFSFVVNLLLLGAAVALGIMSNRVVYGLTKHSEG